MRQTRLLRQATATATAILTAGLLVGAQTGGAQTGGAQTGGAQRPVFRSGVELVTLNVTAVDGRGQPVPGLSASDFTVTVEGQARRVVSADFIDTAASATRSAALAAVSSNEGGGIGRQFIFVVDQGTLETTGARHAARAASRLFSQLTFADRSGLLVLPVGKNVNLTWSHDRVYAALQQLSGTSTGPSGWEYGSLAEARDIANRNVAVLETVGRRQCANVVTSAAAGAGGGTGGGGGGTGTGSTPPPGSGAGSGAAGSSGGGRSTDACMRSVQMQAETTWRMAQMTTLSSLAALRQVLDVLARVPGDKNVILITGGWPLDMHDEITMLQSVAASAAAARVTLLPVFVPRSPYSASRQSMHETPGQDQGLASGPLMTLAALTGGDLYRAEVNAEGVFERLGRERSAYYRLGVEKEAADQDARPRRLQVAVSRSGVTVRTREIFDVRTFEDRNWTARLASALDAPIPADGIPLRVTSYVTLDPSDRTRVNMILAGDARLLQPGGTTVRVVVRDLDGRTVLAGEPPASEATEDGLEFSMTVPVAPGSYIVRVGVMDSAGQVGSVEHRVEARPVPLGTLTATAPLLVRVPAGAGGESRIAVGTARQHERLALEIGLDGERQQVAATDVVFEISRTVDGPALMNLPATISGENDGTLLAQAVANLRLLPPGDYVARALVGASQDAGSGLHRWFTVIGTTAAAGSSEATPATASAGTAAISPRTLGAVHPFALEHVLAPEIVGDFLERVSARPEAASGDLRALFQRARSEGIGGVVVSEALAEGSAAGSFLHGLTLLSDKRFEDAAAAFRASMRVAPDLFPAMVYLGACYAAGGRDKEAAGAWQTALIGTGDTITVHRLLADALLRQGSSERAVVAVERARARWPDDPALAQRFVIASLLGGKAEEGLRILDAQIERSQDVDEPTLALAALVLYESFEQQRPIADARRDRARLLRIADRYRAQGGPSLALIEEWVAAVNGRD